MSRLHRHARHPRRQRHPRRGRGPGPDAGHRGAGPGDRRSQFPNTAYYLPVIYAFTGVKVEKLADLPRCSSARGSSSARARPRSSGCRTWATTLDGGMATLFADEVIEACASPATRAAGTDPRARRVRRRPFTGGDLGVHGDSSSSTGPSTSSCCARGIEFVDGRARVRRHRRRCAGRNEIAVKIARELQEKNLYVFMGGDVNGTQFAEQLQEEGVQLGWETRLVPFGRDVSAPSTRWASPPARPCPSAACSRRLRATSALQQEPHLRLRAGPRRGRRREVRHGRRRHQLRLPHHRRHATSRRSCPPASAPTSTSSPDVPHDMDRRASALEVRGFKIKITKVPIPVALRPGLRGRARSARRTCTSSSAASARTRSSSCACAELDEVEDGKIRSIGPDIDDDRAEGTRPAARHLGRGRPAARCSRTSSRSSSARSTTSSTGPRASGTWASATSSGPRISKSAFDTGFRLRALRRDPARQAPRRVRRHRGQGPGHDLSPTGDEVDELRRSGAQGLRRARRAHRRR